MAEMYAESMNGETPASFQAEDTNPGKWTPDDHADNRMAKSFLEDLKTTYDPNEISRLAGMLSTPIDDEGHGLGDSRLFVRAAARAARKFDEVIRKRENTLDEGRAKGLNFHMPIDQSQRRALQREAQTILEREFMAARIEWIRRSGRSLPGWWR